MGFNLFEAKRVPDRISGTPRKGTGLSADSRSFLPPRERGGYPERSFYDFAVGTFTQFLRQANQGNQVLFFLLVAIAAISLTVGWIGIMNIMLVSVTERTREIGVRMSIGARRRDIRNQFLIEALFLCLLGGTIGLLIGVLVGWLTVGAIVLAILGNSASGTLPLIITPETLILPFAVSAGVGLIFGLYPAIRASRLDPIAALRRAR